ncbi:Xaa-Pro peptidase family protein [Alteromonas sp. ASW11-19]|uniref:Xaa-Pro peptidase family protein n=1 Tax=Alteromonas salexigens TaxID=2982530 RepID=A0ABT2VQI0_9ALTE|nr:Xaa-Pro peptidase family protein [Alteromonas salexigens]MCU7555571.1 Xaa-Pro peptidase family protein [Alteromonas salexigens]
MNKRDFLKFSGLGMAAVATPFALQAQDKDFPTSSRLADITGAVEPISADERAARVSKAQALMKEHDINALVIEPGAAMDYFSGIQWWRSERLTALIIPQQGNVAVVTPFFEKPSVEESLQIDGDIHVWQEHESPYELVVNVLNNHGIKQGAVGFESTVRYFVLHGIMQAGSKLEHVSADPVTLGCRMMKTPHELTLMHKANEVTLRAYEHVYAELKEGMTQADVKALMHDAQQRLGGSNTWCLALFNEASAYPHGTRQQQTIKPGSVVLLDSGCSVHGYQSDISRTFVFGKPNDKQREIWNLVRKGQDIAFNAATLGASAGSVDDAVRKHYRQQGFGPDYQLPGLSHRTGHGIGMEGHESVNFVRGETTKLQPGMCFSNEPGIYIPGEFGVRLEDCLYMGEKGPHWFTEPPASLEKPIGKLVPLAVS